MTRKITLNSDHDPKERIIDPTLAPNTSNTSNMSNVVSHETLIKDFGDLLLMALRINDHIGIAPDQSVTYEGSTNDVDDLRAIVNNLHWKYHHMLDWNGGCPNRR